MGTARNFSVKTGLDIDDGDLTLVSGNILVNAGYIDIDSIKIDGQTISTVTGNEAINITPHGTGTVVISKSELTTTDINGGTIDATNITVGSGKTLTVSDGTLTTSQAQKLAIVQGVGAHTDIGAFNFTASTLIADVADGTAPLTITSTTKVANLNVEQLDGSDWTAAPITNFGTDGSGVDVTFHSATAGDNMLWDTSAKQLKIVGTASSVALDVDTGNFTVGAYGLTNAGAATIASMAGNWTNAGRTVADAGILTTVDINGGTIDATPINSSTIGATSHASGKFTTLQATGTSTLTLANTNLVTVNGTDRSQMTLLQANGTVGAGGTNQITTSERNYSEVRIRQKMGDGNLVHSQVEYMGGAYVIENNTDGAANTGQGVIFTVGSLGAVNTNAWGIGRQAATGKFAIGYSGKDYDNVKDSVGNPMRTGQEYLVLDVSGNLALTVPNTTLSLTSNASSGATEYSTAFKGSASASASATYTLPTAHAGGNGYVLSATTGGILSWIAAGAGETNQNAWGIITVPAGTTTQTAAVDADSIAFTAAGGMTITGGTDTIAFSSANDNTTYSATVAGGVGLSGTAFSLDIDGMGASGALVGADLLPVDDGANGTNKKATFTKVGTLLAGTGLTSTDGVIAVDASQTQITAVGTIATGVWSGTTIVSAKLDADTAHLTTNQTFSGTKTFSASVDMNAGATIDGTVISLDATTSLNIDNSNTTNGISIGTATSGVPVAIGHGTSEVTFGDNVVITGNLTVNGDQTVINSTAIVAEDKSMILGIAGGMEDATFGRSSAVVTITSASHGMGDGEYVYVSNMGNSITDGVYTVSSVATNTFVLDGHSTSGTVGAGATMQHSSANTTEATADGAGIFAPGTSLHSVQYDSSNGWTVSDDLDLVSGKKLSIGGADVFDSATTLSVGVATASGLTTVGTLVGGAIGTNFGVINNGASAITTSGTITGGTVKSSLVTITGAEIGHTSDTDLITLASGLVTVAGEISVTTLDINGTNVTSTAAELNLVDGITAGTVSASLAVIADSDKDVTGFRNVTGTGALQGATLSVDAVAILDTARGAAQNLTGVTNLFSIPKATYKVAKLIYHIKKDTSVDTDAGEILVTHNATTAFLTHYGQVSTGAAVVGTWDCTVNGANIEVRFTPTATGNHTYGITATQMVV